MFIYIYIYIYLCTVFSKQQSRHAEFTWAQAFSLQVLVSVLKVMRNKTEPKASRVWGLMRGYISRVHLVLAFCPGKMVYSRQAGDTGMAADSLCSLHQSLPQDPKLQTLQLEACSEACLKGQRAEGAMLAVMRTALGCLRVPAASLAPPAAWFSICGAGGRLCSLARDGERSSRKEEHYPRKRCQTDGNGRSKIVVLALPDLGMYGGLTPSRWHVRSIWARFASKLLRSH